MGVSHEGQMKWMQKRCSHFVGGAWSQMWLGCADFHVEELEYRAEEGDTSQVWVPLRLIRPKHAKGPLPTVIYLHATGAPTPLPSQPACTEITLIAVKLCAPQECAFDGTWTTYAECAVNAIANLCVPSRSHKLLREHAAGGCVEAHRFTHPDAQHSRGRRQEGSAAPCADPAVLIKANTQGITGLSQEATWIRCGAEQRQAQSGAT